MTAFSKKVTIFSILFVLIVGTVSASTLFDEGFEDGSYSDGSPFNWDDSNCDSSPSVTSNGYIDGSNELSLNGCGGGAKFGGNIGQQVTDPVIRFKFRINSFTSGNDVYFSAWDETVSNVGSGEKRVSIVREDGGDLTVLGSSSTDTLVSGLKTGQVYTVELKNFDFSSETYDIYVNGNLEASGKEFWQSGSGVQSVFPTGDGTDTFVDSVEVCDSGACSASNSAPTVSGEEPSDGASGVGTDPELNITVSDSDGDSMDVSFYDASDDSQIGSTQTGMSSGGTASVTWNGLSNDTTYNWYVDVSDGTDTTQSSSYSFTTQSDTSGGGDPGSGGSGEYRLFEDFEDGDTDKWTLSNDAGGSFTASSSNPIAGTYSGFFQGDSAHSYDSDSFGNTTKNVSFLVRPSSDGFQQIPVDYSGTLVGNLRWNNGNVEWFDGNSFVTVDSYSLGTVYNVTLSPDYGNQEMSIYKNGSLSGTESFRNQVNEISAIRLYGSGDAYYDNFIVEDTSADPSGQDLSISFESQSTSEGRYPDLSSVTGNVSATNASRIDLTLYNTTELIGNASETVKNFSYNQFTGLDTGTYYLNATAFNSTESVSTGTREIVLTDYTDRPAPSQIENISVSNQARRVIWNNDSSMFTIATKNGDVGADEGIIYKRGQYGSPFQSFDLNGTMMLDASWRESRDLIAFFTDQTSRNIQIYDTSDWSFVKSLENDKAHSGSWHPSEEVIIAEDLDDPNNNATLAFYDVSGDPSTWGKVRQTGRYGSDFYKMDVCGDRLVFVSTDKDASPETNVAYVWNISGGDVSQYSEMGSVSGVVKPEFSSSCDYFVVQNHDNQQTGEVYNTDSQSLYESFSVPGSERTSFKFAPDTVSDTANLLSGKIGFGNPDNFGYTDVSNFSTESFTHPLSGSSTWAKEVSWSPDGEILATTQTTEDTVFLWNASYSYTEESPPSITIHSPSGGETVSSSEVDLNVTSTEPADSWKYNLDSTGNTSFTPNTTLDNLSSGGHDLTVWAEFPNSTAKETVSFEVFTTDNEKNIIDSNCSNGFCYTTNSDYNTSNPVSVSGSFYEGQSKSLTWEVEASVAPGDYDFFGFYNSTSSRIAEKFTGISTLTVQENTTGSNNSAPSADFTTTLNELSVSTDASSSSDSDGTITDYQWDWTSDGTYEDTGETSSHTYPSEGNYTITLRVTDDDGATDTASKTVSMVNDTDGGDDGGGDSGGGGSGGDNETDDGSSISVDGTNATLHAPNSGMRYTGNVLEIKEDNSKTIIADGVERQITVENIVNQTHAEILIDQQNLTTYQETEEFTLESGPGITTLLEEVDVRDVVKLNDTGYVYFTLKSGSPATAPLVFDYQVNDSATFTAQYRKAGPGNTWQNIDSVTETSSVEYGFEQFNTTDIQAGVYEARIKVETSDNTNYTEPSGFYIGEVPAIEILRPFNGETVSKPPNGEQYDVPLDYKFEVPESNNVTGIGQYYVDSNGEVHAVLSDRNIDTLEQNSWAENLAELFGWSFDEAYGAFSWLLPQEPDLYYINSTMQVPDYDTYNGYVNSSIETSSGEVTDLNSLPVTVNLVETSVTNESYQDDRVSEVIDESDDPNDVSSPHVNDSFNESIDLDGDNKSDGTFKSPYFWPIKPFNGETLTVKRYDEGEVEFSFDIGYKGNLSVNKSIVLKDSNNETTRINLSKATSQYNDITVNTTQLSTDSWDSNTYTWYGEFTANGTTVYSTENKVNGSSTFKVQEAGALTLASRWIQPVVEGITTVYDVTSDYAEFLVAGFVTVGWYGLFKARKQDFIAKAGGFLWFAGFWWYGAIPQNIQVITIGLASLVAVIKFWRGEVTL